MVELEPADEAAYRQLMRDALAAGARSEAICWYGQLRTALARELGVLPSPSSERLYDECIAGLAAAPAEPLAGPLNRHQVIGAFRRVLVAASEPRPILVVVDDAHAADESSVDALIQLAATGPPVVVALAYRPESAPRALQRGAARLHRAEKAVAIDLGPLDTSDAANLVRTAVSSPPAADVVARIVELGAGNRIALAAEPAEALHVVEEAEESVRGSLETCPGCRITFAVPAAIVAARAGDLDRAAKYEQASDFLASVVMRLPAWNAALVEVRGHIARAHGDTPRAAELFRVAAEGFGAAGQPLDERRCVGLAGEV